MSRQRRHESDEQVQQIPELIELKLFVPDDLYRAFQRCVWIIVNETGRDQPDIMREVVHDFLVKHGC
ncbi:hypothetical protein BMS3Bbin14_01815 [bacterium BMS3Bbin14]|nr:hypothetical protein BMS3Abin13_01557 [bacterium BMS3Abin13]GBE53323.1 hypothetical protein BMS3Bbin14_01815 [bacterium BMS3Bbin14]HDK43626.1 hypothetical protein [Desulfobacteraceae bacterium]HDL98402.1 hypothetical protein [Desulfobacteraceae bacterium]